MARKRKQITLADLPDILLKQEIVRYLRISEATLTRWEQSNGLRVIRLPLGGLRRYFKSDIEKLLQEEYEQQTKS